MQIFIVNYKFYPFLYCALMAFLRFRLHYIGIFLTVLFYQHNSTITIRKWDTSNFDISSRKKPMKIAISPYSHISSITSVLFIFWCKNLFAEHIFIALKLYCSLQLCGHIEIMHKQMELGSKSSFKIRRKSFDTSGKFLQSHFLRKILFCRFEKLAKFSYFNIFPNIISMMLSRHLNTQTSKPRY